MKESTKHILNAPWNGVHANYVYYAVNEVKDAFGNTICQVRQFEEGERLALLPELFDSLDDAQRVLKEVLIEWSNGGDYDTYIAKKRKETGKAPPDYFVDWLKLLKQVAEGNNNDN